MNLNKLIEELENKQFRFNVIRVERDATLRLDLYRVRFVNQSYPIRSAFENIREVILPHETVYKLLKLFKVDITGLLLIGKSEYEVELDKQLKDDIIALLVNTRINYNV